MASVALNRCWVSWWISRSPPRAEAVIDKYYGGNRNFITLAIEARSMSLLIWTEIRVNYANLGGHYSTMLQERDVSRL
jgi:hypothetical protein